MLGFTSAEFTIIDTALARAGVVAVPLQTSAPAEQLRPIIDETEPRALFADVTFLDDAVELVLGAGAALQKVVEGGKQSELESMCRDWPFFSTRLGMLEMVFSKADLWLAEYYDQRLVKPELWARRCSAVG